MRAAVVALLLLPTVVSGQVRPIPERDIERTRVTLDSTVDRFTGLWTVATKGFSRFGVSEFGDELGGGPGLLLPSSKAVVALTLARHGTEGGESAVAMHLKYIGRGGWAYLTGTIRLIVDDTLRIELAGRDRPARSEVGHCTPQSCEVEEVVVATVPDSVLTALAAAHSVEVFVAGERRSFERHFKRQHLALARALARRPAAP